MNLDDQVENRTKEVIYFFALTFIISWGALFLIFGSETIPVTPEQQEMVGMVILLGPSLSCISLLYVFEKGKGIKALLFRLGLWRISWKWYLFGISIAPVTTLISVFIFTIYFPGSSAIFATSEDLFSLAAMGLVAGLFVAFFEELGWTGYATPKLKPGFGIIKTGLIIGLLWGAWHFILFWQVDSFTSIPASLLLLVQLFSWLPAFRILMVWVYDNTQSLLINILMHISLVASLVIMDPVLESNKLLIYILIRAILLWLVVLGIFFIRNHRGLAT